MSNLLHRLDNLGELAQRFRAALENCDPTKLPIGLQAFPSGACADASLLLAKYLQEKGEGKAEYVSGNDSNQTHAWLELDDIIIDITADQFNRSSIPLSLARTQVGTKDSKIDQDVQLLLTITMLIRPSR